MKISPNHLNVNQLFSTSNEQFYIPAYQRRYAWTKKQLGELYDDIRLLKDNENHLLSTIVFLTDVHSPGINSLEVVDGQQRLTTLSILFYALQKKYDSLDDKESVDELKKFLNCRDAKGNQQSKLLLGDLDNPDYNNLIKDNLKKIRNLNLLEAYKFYKEHLPNNKEELNLFYYNLKNNVYIIRLDVSLASDAYRLFESINNRGLRLTATDIIKNFLLGNSSLVNNETLINVRENWKDLIVNLDGIIPDNFFRQYLAGILKRKITVSKLIEEFKKYYFSQVKESSLLSEYSLFSNSAYGENEDELEDASIKADDDADAATADDDDKVNDEGNGEEENGDEANDAPKTKENNKKISITVFSKYLSEDAEVYAKIVKRKFSNTKINKKLSNLSRIKSLPTYTLLLDLFQRELDDRDMLKILSFLETFMLRWHICEYRTSQLDDIFPKLVGLKDKDLIDNIKDELKKEMPGKPEFIEKIVKYNFKGNIERAKFILEEIEYYIIKDQGEYTLKTGKELHLEHIIPQKIKTKKSKKEFGDWVKYLGPEALTKHKDYVNRIGNFTLLAEKLNIVARNNPFLNKKREYKKSNIQLTKDIVTKYGKFQFKHVDKRSKYLADIAAKIWDF